MRESRFPDVWSGLLNGMATPSLAKPMRTNPKGQHSWVGLTTVSNGQALHRAGRAWTVCATHSAHMWTTVVQSKTCSATTVVLTCAV